MQPYFGWSNESNPKFFLRRRHVKNDVQETPRVNAHRSSAPCRPDLNLVGSQQAKMAWILWPKCLQNVSKCLKNHGEKGRIPNLCYPKISHKKRYMMLCGRDLHFFIFLSCPEMAQQPAVASQGTELNRQRFGLKRWASHF